MYEQDFYKWTQKQSGLLKAGLLDQLDTENLREEIESLGRSEKRELVSRLTVLLMHMLKWDHQQDRRCRSWELTIKNQREEVGDVLEDSPSLAPRLDEFLPKAYRKARLRVAAETDLPEAAFPATCPYAIEQIMGD